MGQNFTEMGYRRKLINGNLNSQLVPIKDEVPTYVPPPEVKKPDWNSPINLYVIKVVKRKSLSGENDKFRVGKWDG